MARAFWGPMSSPSVLSAGWSAAVQGPPPSRDRPLEQAPNRHHEVAGTRATEWPAASKMAFVWAPAEAKSTAP